MRKNVSSNEGEIFPYPSLLLYSISRDLNSMLIPSPFVFHLGKQILNTLDKCSFQYPGQNRVIKPLIIEVLGVPG